MSLFEEANLKATLGLVELGAHLISHSNTTLLRHLEGTSEILRDWGCEKDTILAGLYHSVYGTKSFNCSLVDPESGRDFVIKMVGARAEALVRAFSVRHCEDLDAADPFRAELLMIHMANRLEQLLRVGFRNRSYVRDDLEFFLRFGHSMNKEAKETCSFLFSRRESGGS